MCQSSLLVMRIYGDVSAAGVTASLKLDTDVNVKLEESVRIGELAARTGVSTRSLRYYEQQGLLSAGRTGGGQREYDGSAVDRVRRIRELFGAGLNSPKIRKVLPCIRDADGGPSAAADAQLAADLTEERERITKLIADLQGSLRSLDQVIRTATKSHQAGQSR